MKNIYICRSIPVGEDSRVLRYAQIAQNKGLKLNFVQWGEGESFECTAQVPLPRYRGRPLLNMFMTPIFSLWLMFYLLLKLKKGDVVLAIDLDTGLPSLVAALLKRAVFIYDIADPFSLCRFNRSISLVNYIEGVVAKSAALSIIPSRSRALFYSKKIDFCIIENVPDFPSFDVQYKNFQNHQLNIGYFGNLEKDYRGLELMASVVAQRNDLILHVGGAGSLSDYFEELARVFPCKFKFYGKYKPSDLPKLLSNCEVLMAVYSTKKEHHKYVAANKLYEHLACAKPVITNLGTNFSDDIINWGTGWCVEESFASFSSLVDKILFDKECIEDMSLKAFDLWRRNYQDYWISARGVKQFSLVIE